jgi:hypothetical protein
MVFEVDGNFDLIRSISSAFSEPLHDYFLNRCVQLFTLDLRKVARALFNEAVSAIGPIFIEDMRLFSDRSAASPGSFFSPLERKSFYDHEVAASLRPGEAPIRYPDRDLLSAVPSTDFGEIRFWATHHCRIDTSLSLLIAYKQYDRAYQILMGISDSHARGASFVHHFVQVAIFRQELESVKKFILTHDRDLDITAHLFRYLIHFLTEREMNVSLLDIYTFMNSHDEAMDVALRIYAQSLSLERRIYYLGFASISLSLAIDQRISPMNSSPPYRPNSRSLSELRELAAMIELQERLNQICYARKLKFSSRLDFITEPASAGNAAGFFLLFGDTAASDDLARRRRLSAGRVLDFAIQFFQETGPDSVVKFAVDYIQSRSGRERQKAICRILDGLARGPHFGLLGLVISEIDLGEPRQSFLLCEFDWLFEALNAAELAEVPEALPMIAYRASLLGVENIWKECEAILRERLTLKGEHK